MNYEPMTTVEKRVQRNRRIRWLIIGLLIIWGLYCWGQWGFVLASTSLPSMAGSVIPNINLP